MKQIQNTMNNIKFIEKKTKNSNDLLEKDMNYSGNSKIRIKQLIREILIKKWKNCLKFQGGWLIAESIGYYVLYTIIFVQRWFYSYDKLYNKKSLGLIYSIASW